MTREEAIKQIKDMMDYFVVQTKNEIDPLFDRETVNNDIEALAMAIKALEQEPCDDAISRQAVLDYVDKMPSELTADGRRMIRRRTLEEYISDTLPSVIPHYTNAEIQKMQEMEQAEIQKSYELGKASQPKIGHCKDCKHWKDSDGTYRRDIYAESKCPMNCKEVYEGTGYCFLFELKVESEVEE